MIRNRFVLDYVLLFGLRLHEHSRWRWSARTGRIMVDLDLDLFKSGFCAILYYSLLILTLLNFLLNIAHVFIFDSFIFKLIVFNIL